MAGSVTDKLVTIGELKIGLDTKVNASDVQDIEHGGTNAATAAAARTNLDIYSKSETDSAIAQSTASSYEKWTATGATSGNIYLARSGKVRVMSFEDVVVPAGSSFSIATIPAEDRPVFLSVGSLFAGNGACASVWVRTSGTFGSSGAIGHTLNGSIVWITA